MNKAYVTGGSGFVGRNLIRALVDRGYQVVAATRTAGAAAAVRALGAEPAGADLSDPKSLAQGMDGCALVVHAAAKVEQWGPLDEFRRVNVEGTENVIGAARISGVRRLVHVGTEAVLVGGRRIVQADESWPLSQSPPGPYEATKALAEMRVLAANAGDLATVVVRPRFIWGRDDTSLLPKLVEAVKGGKFAWIAGGKYLTSTCHVANVAEGILLAAERGQAGGVYFLTDGPPIEFRRFVTALLETQGLTAPTRSMPRSLAKALAFLLEAVWPARAATPPPITRTMLALMGEEVTVNDGRARTELGYREVVTREQGLAEMSAKAAQLAPAPRQGDPVHAQ
jgi:nucleoside-diphosphate-sugar epimerase